jgi:hypothetical protein
MPRKTATRICTLLIGVAAMLLFASTASAACPTCTTLNLGCAAGGCPQKPDCNKSIDYEEICDDGTSHHYAGPCCSCA